MDTMLIPLTQGLFARVDVSDALRVMEHRWHAIRSRRNGQGHYAMHNVYSPQGYTRLYMHRVILCPNDDMQVDHIDGDGLNNTRANLRQATNTLNQANRRKLPGTSSRFKGVYRHRGEKRWTARIVVNRKKVYLGCFADEVDAGVAYDNAARLLWGEFARPNFKNAADIQAAIDERNAMKQVGVA